MAAPGNYNEKTASSPEKFESGGFTLKTHQMCSVCTTPELETDQICSVHTIQEKFESATIIGHFGFVLEKIYRIIKIDLTFMILSVEFVRKIHRC